MKILSLSGFTPEQICDTVRFTQYVGDRNIAHYCGYASDFISQVLQDDSVDGALFPKSCDSTRIIGSYLADSGKFVHQINIPSVGAAGEHEYFARELIRFKGAVEAHYGVRIDDGTVDDRIGLVNERNRALKRLYENVEDLSYPDYLDGIHGLLARPLEEQTSLPEIGPGRQGKRIFILGSFLSNTELLRGAADAGLQVVGDTLPESGRLAARPEAAPGSGRYTSIAASILSSSLSPTQNRFRATLERDLAEIRRKGAAGALFILQEYCEPYDYYYSIAKPALEAEGIRVASLSVGATTDAGRAKLTLEAFADLL